MKVNVLSSIVLFIFLIALSNQNPIHFQVIDLTHYLNNQSHAWFEDRRVAIRTLYNGTKNFGQTPVWYQTDEIEVSVHSGTHIDAPAHFGQGKWSISDIPLTNLIDKRVAVIDVVNEVNSNRDHQVNEFEIQRNEQLYGRIPAEAVVLLRTGWSRYWISRENYFGTATNDSSQLHFPGNSSSINYLLISYVVAGLAPSAAKWLVQNRNIVGVGIEGPSIDFGQTRTVESHTVLAAANKFIIENLNSNMNRLPFRGATITVAPLNLDHGSGSPSRVWVKNPLQVINHIG